MARVKGVSRNAQLLEVGGPFPAPSTLLRIRIARGVVIYAMCKLLRWIVSMPFSKQQCVPYQTVKSKLPWKRKD